MISVRNISSRGVSHTPGHILKCLNEALIAKPTQQDKMLILLNQGYTQSKSRAFTISLSTAV